MLHNERLNAKTEGSSSLNSSHTLGDTGRNNGKPGNGSSGHARGMRPGQRHKKPKDLSTREREERGRGGGRGVCDVCKCERVA